MERLSIKWGDGEGWIRRKNMHLYYDIRRKNMRFYLDIRRKNMHN